MGVWGKHMKSPCFRTLRSYQKMNHIPGTFQLGRKDRIWRNLQTQMSRHGKKEFSFMPHTYILPQDLRRFKRLWPRYEQKNTKWIIKPPASARGTGIKVVNKWTQIPKRKPLIVQKWVPFCRRQNVDADDAVDLEIGVCLFLPTPSTELISFLFSFLFSFFDFHFDTDTLTDPSWLMAANSICACMCWWRQWIRCECTCTPMVWLVSLQVWVHKMLSFRRDCSTQVLSIEMFALTN